MRWIWLDRIVELETAKRCVAIKNITAAEDVLHDHFLANDQRPALPLMPHSLVIEGMAQTAGILVGHANGFKEKVVLAKISKAVFEGIAGPGQTLRFTAVVERLDESGASASGAVELMDSSNGQARPFAEINLMFSHIDQNRSGLAFPEHNFVFSSTLADLLRLSGIDMNQPTTNG